MPDETDPNKAAAPTPEEIQKKAEETSRKMLRTLGYFVEEKEQEKLPDEGAGEEPKSETTEETKTEEGEPKPSESTTDPEKKPETTEEPKPGDETAASLDPARRARKLPGDEEEPAAKPLTKEDIVDSVRTALEKKEETAPKKDDPLAKYGELSAPERRALELARDAARLMPDRYKDMETREIQWISKCREYVNKVIEERGEFTNADTQTEEFQTLERQFKPRYQAGDREDLFMARAEERALAKAEAKFQKEKEELIQRLNTVEAGPQIKKTVAVVEDDVLGALDKPIADAIKADATKAMDAYGIEVPLAIAVVTDTQHNVHEYLAIAKDIKKYDHTNEAHRKVVDFIRKQGEFLDAMPTEKRMRDGKILVSRERWGDMIEKKQDVSRYDTFRDADVVNMLAGAGRRYLGNLIKAEHTRLEKAGYKRAGAPAAAATTTPPQKTETPPGKEEKKTETAPAAVTKPPVKAAAPNPPKGGATPAPGATAGAKPPPAKGEPAVLRALGYDKV